MPEERAGRSAESRAVMERSTEDLRAAGLLDRLARVGQPAPEFALPNTSGVEVTLAGLRTQGAVVRSFYRGRCGIRAVDADPDDTRRPEPAQTVEVLRTLPSCAAR